MKHMYTLFVPVIFLLTAHVAHAQGILEQGELSVYTGLTFPTGDFGDDIGGLDDGNGYAKLGFTLVGEYTHPIGTPGLGWVASISLMANGFDDEEAFEGADDAGVDINSGYWFNVPVMTGLKYQMEASPTLDLYGLGQVGLNLNKGPTIELENDAGNRVDFSFGTSTSFGFGVGAGLVVNDRYNLSLRYLKLGEPELEVEFESDAGSGDDDYDQPVSLIQLLVGISLDSYN